MHNANPCNNNNDNAIKIYLFILYSALDVRAVYTEYVLNIQ